MGPEPFDRRSEGPPLTRSAVPTARVLSLRAVLPVLTPVRTETHVSVSEEFVLDDMAVPSVAITRDRAHLDDLFGPDYQYSDDDRSAIFAFRLGPDGMRACSVSFRYRGKTLLDSQKRPFRVLSRPFGRGQKLPGLEVLNIKGERT